VKIKALGAASITETPANAAGEGEGEDDVEPLVAEVPVAHAGWRLDRSLALLFGDFSRARLQQWVKDGRVTVDDVVLRPRDKVRGGERVVLHPILECQVELHPQAIPLRIVHQDESLLVIDKPAGLVVHPAAGNPDGTLVNGLLHLDPALSLLPRAGIVHRLDKDTTGLLVVARTPAAHRHLVEELQARRIRREYRALVVGVVTAGGIVDAPIGRHPAQRTRMAVVPGGRSAITHYRVLRRFRGHSLLRVQLETGRTHQIRVHMAHIHFPVLGDPVYGGRLRLPAGASQELAERLRGFRRQALHACRLGLTHPGTSEWMEWVSEPPEDMQELLGALEADAEGR